MTIQPKNKGYKSVGAKGMEQINIKLETSYATLEALYSELVNTNLLQKQLLDDNRILKDALVRSKRSEHNIKVAIARYNPESAKDMSFEAPVKRPDHNRSYSNPGDLDLFHQEKERIEGPMRFNRPAISYRQHQGPQHLYTSFLSDASDSLTPIPQDFPSFIENNSDELSPFKEDSVIIDVFFTDN